MEESYKDRFLSFISKPLFVGLFFSLYTIFVRFYLYPKYSVFLNPDFELIQNFIEWFGVAYGLFIALVLVNVWAQFETTEREFDREADAIFMLYESTRQIKETRKTRTLKQKIIAGLRVYVEHVTSNFEREHQNLRIRDAGDKILEDLRVWIGELIHTDERESITSELIKEFNEAVDLRGDRISHSKQRIPDPVWGISLASSILWLIPFYGLNFTNDWVAIILVGGVTAVVVAILVIIRDLDDPFEGTWRINISEWELLGEKIELKPTLFFVYSLDSSRFSAIRFFINQLFSKHLCALYSLLNKVEKQKVLFNGLTKSAYLRVYYKDELEDLYEDFIDLPAVIYKSNSNMSVLVKSADISEVTRLDDLMLITQEKLATVHPC